MTVAFGWPFDTRSHDMAKTMKDKENVWFIENEQLTNVVTASCLCLLQEEKLHLQQAQHQGKQEVSILQVVLRGFWEVTLHALPITSGILNPNVISSSLCHYFITPCAPDRDWDHWA